MPVPFEIITLGRVGVDLYPEQAGPFEDVRTFAKSIGGTATNVAIAAARLGRRAAVITAVGDDIPGRYVRSALARHGVDDRFVVTNPRLPTPIVLCELDPPDDPKLIFYRHPKAPDMEIGPEDLDLGAVREAGIFWCTGTGLSDEPHRSALMAALAERSRRRFTVLDLDWRSMFWSRRR